MPFWSADGPRERRATRPGSATSASRVEKTPASNIRCCWTACRGDRRARGEFPKRTGSRAIRPFRESDPEASPAGKERSLSEGSRRRRIHANVGTIKAIQRIPAEKTSQASEVADERDSASIDAIRAIRPLERRAAVCRQRAARPIPEEVARVAVGPQGVNENAGHTGAPPHPRSRPGVDGAGNPGGRGRNGSGW